jgi:hypothetical protein
MVRPDSPNYRSTTGRFGIRCHARALESARFSMFIGHFAVAFAVKRAMPALSLGTLFLAAQFADLLWPTLVLLGVESFTVRPGITAVTPLDFVYYPWSHSLLALALWGMGLAAVWAVVRRGSVAGALALIAVVVSHWVLDWVTHRPDMPLTVAGEGRYGLGLWNSLPATLGVEGVMFAGAVALYAHASSPKDRTGRWALGGLVAFLAVVYLANLFGPPPPSVQAVALSAQAIWLLVAWGYWVDRRRLTY